PEEQAQGDRDDGGAQQRDAGVVEVLPEPVGDAVLAVPVRRGGEPLPGAHEFVHVVASSRARRARRAARLSRRAHGVSTLCAMTSAASQTTARSTVSTMPT